MGQDTPGPAEHLWRGCSPRRTATIQEAAEERQGQASAPSSRPGRRQHRGGVCLHVCSSSSPPLIPLIPSPLLPSRGVEKGPEGWGVIHGPPARQRWARLPLGSCLQPEAPPRPSPPCAPSPSSPRSLLSHPIPTGPGAGLQRQAAEGLSQCHHALGHAPPGRLQLPLAGAGPSWEEREGV